MHPPDLPDFSQMTRREIEDYLIERAMVEPPFRKGLLETPHELLQSIGLPIGDDVKIRVLEEVPKSFYLILPRILPDLKEIEDEASDRTAGGSGQNCQMLHFFQGYT